MFFSIVCSSYWKTSYLSCSDRWCGRGDRVWLTPGNLDKRALQEKGALINLKFDRECPPLYSLKWCHRNIYNFDKIYISKWHAPLIPKWLQISNYNFVVSSTPNVLCTLWWALHERTLHSRWFPSLDPEFFFFFAVKFLSKWHALGFLMH
jgi:hypothetical protein